MIKIFMGGGGAPGKMQEKTQDIEEKKRKKKKTLSWQKIKLSARFQGLSGREAHHYIWDYIQSAHVVVDVGSVNVSVDSVVQPVVVVVDVEVT